MAGAADLADDVICLSGAPLEAAIRGVRSGAAVFIAIGFTPFLPTGFDTSGLLDNGLTDTGAANILPLVDLAAGLAVFTRFEGLVVLAIRESFDLPTFALIGACDLDAGRAAREEADLFFPVALALERGDRVFANFLVVGRFFAADLATDDSLLSTYASATAPQQDRKFTERLTLPEPRASVNPAACKSYG